MSKREADEVTGVETTGHEWDGIKELDNPLPRWWLYVFWASIVVAIVYWVLLPAWPGINGYTKGLMGQSDRANVAQELQALRDLRGEGAARLTHATLEEIESDPALQEYAMAVGQSVFGDNCATCHGAGGGGAKGYPNLVDDIWLWGGSLADIHHTLQVGVRSGAQGARFSQMPAFGRDQMLTGPQINDLTELVVSLSGREADKAAVERAAPIYAAQCVSCHGAAGTGDQAQGAPNLTDGEWLYGASREEIRTQIWSGRNGVMPSWAGRFDDETLKALAVYVHANAGGQ
ncbi:cytochrome-c oxidase, cbb3-type subunit III [Phenylobacterium sp.]|uniref:cytochrome-c oxidase, cbb3-type subunit III n=1 Tax=Phenylobacterium sp. TaxID=1871053 RepID=UPI002731B6D4|nr:cytochrome-c oxidase, cbb3-type subunit III [Phenylobacterium sp.]MDP1619320.1 cytochrome-c oxidase, cbb3-type subunit III [Phenylobacterium sp.]MDP1986242.1 cytochrome-c oxidase, cbb3-type subunit III [Phenylobacterium sp.]